METASKTGVSISSVTYAGIPVLLKAPVLADTNSVQQTGYYESTGTNGSSGIPTGTNNLSFTLSIAAVNIGVGVSATGVLQSSPCSHIVSTSGFTLTPSLPILSASNEFLIGTLGYKGFTGGSLTSDTIDAAWTADFSGRNAGNDLGVTAGHRVTGAASVTRTDTLSLSQNFTFVMASIKPAPSSSAKRFFWMRR
jgi:hypothetical protein